MARYFALGIITLTGGILIGGYLFSDTKPRSILNVAECGQYCLSNEEILGLLGSLGVQRFSDALPFVEKETEKTLAIRHPFPQAEVHYVIFPKKDIKAAEDISQEDIPYIMDAYAVMAELIKEQNLRDYKIVMNGPGFQTVGYLHFHLVADLPR